MSDMSHMTGIRSVLFPYLLFNLFQFSKYLFKNSRFFLSLSDCPDSRRPVFILRNLL